MKKIFLIPLFLLAAFLSNGQSLVGSITSLGGGEYNITPPGSCGAAISAGAYWSTSTVDFTHYFALQFEANFDIYSGIGADGICAVFGNNINIASSINYKGGALGYYNYPWGTINPDFQQSIAVEFDIFDNNSGGPYGTPPLYDLQYDHCAITENGVAAPLSGGGPVLMNGTTGMRDGSYHDYLIIWCPTPGPSLTGYITVIKDGSVTLLNTPFTPSTVFSTSALTAINWGITGATQVDCSNQRIKNIHTTTSTTLTTTLNLTPCDGTPLTLTAPGSPYTTHHWDNGSTSSSRTVTTSGVYTCTSTGASACATMVTTYNVNYEAAPIFTPSVSYVPNDCIGGTADLNSGMTSCLGCTYSWIGPVMTTTAQNPALYLSSTYDAGTYSLTITNPLGGCSATETVNVTVATIPAPTISPIPAICTGYTTTLSGTPPGRLLVCGGRYRQCIYHRRQHITRSLSRHGYRELYRYQYLWHRICACYRNNTKCTLYLPFIRYASLRRRHPGSLQHRGRRMHGMRIRMDGAARLHVRTCRSYNLAGVAE